MKDSILSLIMFLIILLIFGGQDNQNINKTLTPIDDEAPIAIENCEWIPDYLCKREPHPDSIIDLHVPAEGPCGYYSIICCNPEDQVLSPVCEIENKPNPCGIRNSYGIGFPIKRENDIPSNDNNAEAEYGEFPWTVAVLGEEAVEGSTEKSLRFQCGGSLIHPQVVLTTAHSVNSTDKKFSIRAGVWDAQNKNELFPHQNRNVKNVITHPNFYIGSLHNDVALLILDEPLEIVENVQTVCLPPPNEVLENVTCFQSSWHKNTFEVEGKPHAILNKAKIRVVPQNDCQERFRRTRMGEQFILDKSFICSESDDCKGSGGSPLVCPIPGNSNKYYLSGILSWGLGCVENPGVYVNIAKFKKWIDDEMLKLHFAASSYTV